MGTEGFLDCLKLSEKDRLALLDKLDAEAAKSSNKPRRVHSRHEYRANPVTVTFTHPGGTHARFYVVCRNLSAGGMSFLHGGFLHNQTECRILLHTAAGQPKVLIGHVRTCRHVHKNIHEIGVQFTEKIDPELFCAPGAALTSVDAVGGSEPLPSLTGDVLVISEDVSVLGILSQVLGSAGMNAVASHSLGQALDQLRRLPLSAVVFDLDRCGETPADAIGAIRATAFKGPVIAIMGDSSNAMRISAIKAGANQSLGKPIDGVPLVRALAAELAGAGQREEGAIYSELKGSSGGDDLVHYFVDQARVAARQLAQSLAAENLDDLLKTVRMLKGTAGGYGFPGVAEAARLAENALETTATLNEARRSIEFLAGMCRRVAAAPAAPGETRSAA